MARPTCYVPAVDRFLVKALHHEARHRGVPMTRLLDGLLRDALRGGPGWHLAEDEIGYGTPRTAGATRNPKPEQPTDSAAG